MANEFKARNGLIAQNNSVITGSLIVTNGITGSFTGSLTGSLFGTASYASTYAPVFPYTGSAIISGSLEVTGSIRALVIGSDLVNIGNASTTNQRLVRIGQDTSYIDIGSLVGATSFGALYFNQSTPSSTNFTILANATQTVFNGTTSLTLRVNNGNAVNFTQTSTQFNTVAAASSGAVIPYSFASIGNTNQTLSTNIPNFRITGANKQWATGNITNQYWNYLTANTASFVGASTITSSYGLFVEAATTGTNATITNNFALGTTGRVQIKGSSSDLIDLGTNDGGFYNIKLGYNGVIGSTTGPQQLGNLGASALGYYLPSSANGSSVLANTWATGKITYQAYQHNFTFQSSANQSAEYSRLLITGGQVNFTSSISTQRFAYLTSPTIVFNTSNTVTSSYGLFVEAATAGTNATITNNYAAGFSGSVQIQAGSIPGQGIVIRDLVGSATNSAIYMGVSPSSTNYAIRADAFGNNFINGGQLFLCVGGASQVLMNGASIAFQSNNIQTSGVTTQYQFSPANNTGQTASTEIPLFNINSATTTWLTGNITTQRNIWFKTRTLSFAGASTVTSSYGLYVEAATAGTNATITDNWALGLGGNLRIDNNGKYFKIYQNGNNAYLDSENNVVLAKAGTAYMVVGGSGTITIGDSINIIAGTTTGTKLGTATTQKLSFWNATPVTQSVSSTAIDTLVDRIGLRASGGSANFDTPITASIISGSSITGSLFGTASYATQTLTASYASTYASVFPFTGSAIITGSFEVTGSISSNIPSTVMKSYIGDISGSSFSSGIYLLNASTARTANNYTLRVDQSNLELNALSTTGYIDFRANQSPLLTLYGSSPSSTLTNTIFTTKNRTLNTSGTEVSNIQVTSATKTYPSGNLANHRDIWFKTQTLAFNGSSTITSSYGLFVEAATAGTNATITNNYALGTNGNVIFDDSTSKMIWRAVPTIPSYSGIFLNVNPNSTNFTLANDGSGNTFLNGVSSVYIAANGTNVARFGATYQLCTPVAASSGALIKWQLTVPADTNQTLSTNIPNFRITGANKQWATGNITNQYWNYLTANTASFVGASTISESIALQVDAATAGTNATITNNFSLGLSHGTGTVKIGNVNGSSVSSAIYMNRATPSSNNYVIKGTNTAAYFNSDSTSYICVGDINGIIVDSQSLTFNVPFSGGVSGDFIFNGKAKSGLTASTNIPMFRVNGATNTFGTGALTNQYFSYFKSNTLAFAGTSTATNVYGLFVEATTAGTNATITNNYAAGFSGSIQVLNGNAQISNAITSSTLLVSGSGVSRLTIVGSGSSQPIFTVQGSQGELFSITDSLSGSLFSVNDISGLPIVEVFSDNTTLMGSYLNPMLITTVKVTQTNSGSFVVYSLPTSSYDTAFYEYSIKSGSNGRAGTIMAIQSGSSVNYTEVVTTDFGSTSAATFSVTVSGSNIILSGSSTTGSWTTKCIIRGL